MCSQMSEYEDCEVAISGLKYGPTTVYAYILGTMVRK